jgi:four helix bundle protein
MLNVKGDRVDNSSQPPWDIQERAFQFAFRIVNLYDYLITKRDAARLIARQVFDAGTSVGANLGEADSAQSKADFNSKCSIALKEARESRYWLRLLSGCKSVKQELVTPLTNEAGELVAILTAIVKKAERSRHRG